MPFKPDLLREKLKAAGKTQSFLAKKTNRTERTVSRWLNGKNPPKDKDLKKIADALGCTPQEFDPNFADVGKGDVPIHARISNASHNAYEILNRRYGTSQRDIIEAGPVLFSIVAALGLKIPSDDEALGNEIRRHGGTPWYGRGPDISEGFDIDMAASQNRECFGRLPPPDTASPTRNLFFEAVLRLSDNLKDTVDTEYLVTPAPGVPISAAGFNPDVDFLNLITGGDTDLIKAVIYGKVRLSKCLEEHEQSKDRTLEAFIAILRREMALSDRKAVERREAWHASYKDRHPDMAHEFDQIVEKYCRGNGREHFWSDPELDEELLPEEQRVRVERQQVEGKHGGLKIIPPKHSTILMRFIKLKFHRAEDWREFEEAYDE
ncbi:helix-turn-helix transcriptional regulator [Tropicimonas sp. IMCC6043]|uniref:helix-turn-helix domain-containing protein n=1 Tax=Tropicimonas sp. IMCC6043 TaxID=2510645 RepID=UPI00101C6B7C|nr:helix-turn-helix domain-containing protein [Tropicimonas sp. IMCC6043]RYH06527.1 helix-turn-helix domain-containing protein [Tropicimonas sp. IMCC6043]